MSIAFQNPMGGQRPQNDWGTAIANAINAFAAHQAKPKSPAEQEYLNARTEALRAKTAGASQPASKAALQEIAAGSAGIPLAEFMRAHDRF